MNEEVKDTFLKRSAIIKEIRNYILSELDEDWCDSVENYPIVYNNIVNLAFMYCFSCYHELNNCIDEKGI